MSKYGVTVVSIAYQIIKYPNWKLQFKLIATLLQNLDLKTDHENLTLESLKEIDMFIIDQTLGNPWTNAKSICDDEFDSFGIGLCHLLSIVN